MNGEVSRETLEAAATRFFKKVYIHKKKKENTTMD